MGTGLIALLLVALVVLATVLWSGDEAPAATPPPPREARVDVLDGPNRDQRVQLDVTLYAPSDTPSPAILLAHGFGGDKESVSRQARDLAQRGFTVLTYSARGFGASTGEIALNHPDYEVADARQLLDWLARQPEVLRDGDGDPRVGVTGSSYGGALALSLAGTDPRVDAIAPVMTYNDLGRALLPNMASNTAIDRRTPAAPADPDSAGVFKQAWAGLLFSAGTGRNTAGATESAPPGTPSMCGRFVAEICAAYIEVAQSGRASAATRDLLDTVSPKRVTENIEAPTLLMQGEQDSLFGLDEADANARQISQSGGDVKVVWHAGGHDGAALAPERHADVADWFAHHLGDVPPGPDPGTGFQYDVAGRPQRDGERPVRTVLAPEYPGARADRAARFDVPLRGDTAEIINPPGGTPSGTSALPGAVQDAAGSLGQSVVHEIPDQTAKFRSTPMAQQLLISGSAQTRLSVASTPGQPRRDDAVLFTKLYDVAPDGQRSLLGNAVAPLRVTDLPPDESPVEVDVALPGVVHSVEPGHRVELAVTTTDQAYAGPHEPAAYRVGLPGSGSLSIPSVRGADISAGTVPTTPLIGIGALGGFVATAWVISRIRRRGDTAAPELTDTPLNITEVSKSYGRSTNAVQDVSLRVGRGQIVGLLGPNGAGKSTTLGMLLGLLHADTGAIRVFGHDVRPGAPVLSRIGSLVESPGFLPHLSGLDNLRSYWAATGRPILQARFDEVLRIAGLGEHAHRRVRTYGRGMKQRLAIAQAMLGLPDLLVLDEPTNGLDPPQIQQLREMLRRYAATGRAVLISSHLLAEVERTCTDVVVMHEGRVIAQGTVAEIVSANDEVTFQVDDPGTVVETLHELGIDTVDQDQEDNAVHAKLATHSTAAVVNALVSAGVSVYQVGPRRRLEDAFLRLVGEEQ